MSEEHPSLEPPDPLVGHVLADRYRIERRLGEGGMGVVYLARHVILEKVVALKVLHHEYARRRELVERFLHEAKAASRIRHEHVIDITDFGETPDKNVFFAMEFLDGHDLAGEMDKGVGVGMQWPRAKSVILQICSALQSAHEAGVIHRDLKPENVYLIEKFGHHDFVKVLDFGVAKIIDGEQDGRRLTKTGMVFGTPEYMSPEQAKGEKPDPRVDIYACGCMLFEMLTGDVPYHADSFMGVLTKHLLDPIPRLAERNPRTDLPSGLQEVIEQALAKDREQRFETMNELAVAIDTLDEIDGVAYRAPGTSERDRARSKDGLRSDTAPPRTRSPVPEVGPSAAMPPPAPAELPPAPPIELPRARARSAPPVAEAAAPVDIGFDYLPRRRVSMGTLGVAAAVLVVAVGAIAVLSSGSGTPPATPTTTEAKPAVAAPAPPPPAAAAPAPPPTTVAAPEPAPTAPEPAPAPPPTTVATPEPAPAAPPPTVATPEPVPAAVPPTTAPETAATSPPPAVVAEPPAAPTKPAVTAPEPAPVAPAATREPVPTTASPPPAPEPAVAPAPPPAKAAVAAPPPAKQRTRAADTARKRGRDRGRDKKPPAIRPTIPTIVSEPPEPKPAAAPAPPPPEKKTDLKDPFKKR